MSLPASTTGLALATLTIAVAIVQQPLSSVTFNATMRDIGPSRLEAENITDVPVASTLKLLPS